MADKKISALTAASTPLAGTEVLPIVQSGATVKVAVSDLTAGRSVSAADLTAPYIYNETRRAAPPTYLGNIYIWGSNPAANGGIEFQTASVNSGYGFRLAGDSGADELIVQTRNNSASWTNAWSFGLDNNVTQKVAAKGVNFTANTPNAGMTSQLLNWYEEGTFTPTIIGSSTAGTASYSTQSAKYTRIGRMTYFALELIWTGGTGTGGLRIAGLPFTCGANNCAVSIGDIENVALTALYTAGAYVAANSTVIVIREFAVGGGGNNPVNYDAAGTLRIGGCYYI